MPVDLLIHSTMKSESRISGTRMFSIAYSATSSSIPGFSPGPQPEERSGACRSSKSAIAINPAFFMPPL